MYKAIQKFADQSSSSHTLSFNVGDTFCILEKTNVSWWLASKTTGETGYVPCQYIKPCENVCYKIEWSVLSINVDWLSRDHSIVFKYIL